VNARPRSRAGRSRGVRRKGIASSAVTGSRRRPDGTLDQVHDRPPPVQGPQRDAQRRHHCLYQIRRVLPNGERLSAVSASSATRTMRADEYSPLCFALLKASSTHARGCRSGLRCDHRPHSTADISSPGIMPYVRYRIPQSARPRRLSLAGHGVCGAPSWCLAVRL
jgi:hypothetical protein